jgi:hypothetical protein
MSSGTFAAFSKFLLNTSNSHNTKVVYFVEGHNFHVEWHCWFELQMGEKLKSMLLVIVNRHPENSQLGIQFVQKWLRKRPYAICESCRGSGDLQLCYSLLGPLLFNFLEICSVKQGCLRKFTSTRALERVGRADAARRPRRGSSGPGRRGRPRSVIPAPWTHPTCAAPPSSPTIFVPRAAHPVDERADPAAADH